MSLPELVVFDLDDTLILNKIDFVILWRDLLKKYLGREIEYFEVVQAPSSTDRMFCEHFLKDSNQVEECLSKLKNYYYENLDKFWLPEGVSELLNKLKKADSKLAIFSARDRETGEFLLKHFDIEKYFDAFVFTEDVKRQKPHSEGLEKILQRLKIEEKNALLVGNTKDDFEPAKALEVEFFRVNWFRKGPNAWENLHNRLFV